MLRPWLMLIMFFFIHCLVFATNPRKLSEAQDFIVPADAPNGEYIGYIKAFPEFEMIGVAPTFVLKTNVDGIYVVSSAGLITISNNTSLSAGSDVIVVTVSKTGYANIDINITILCLATASCIYIDPGSGTNGIGTRADPLNIKPTTVSNKNYLFKRGTKLELTYPYIDITDLDNIIIGSYGTGDRPILSAFGTWEIVHISTGCTNITIRDIEGTTTEPAKSNPTANYNNWSHGLCYELTTQLFRIINCEMHHMYWGCMSNSSASASNSNNVEIKWNYVHDIAQDGIAMYGNTIVHSGVVYVESNKIIGVQQLWNYSHVHAESGGDAIQMSGVHEYYCRHNYIDNSSIGGSHCILMTFSGDLEGTEWVEVSNNYLISDVGGYTGELYALFMIMDEMDRGVIFNNTLIASGPFTIGVYCYSRGAQTSVYNNVFINCPGGVYGIRGGTYNNVFYNCGDLFVYRMTSIALPGTFKNNIIYFTKAEQHAYYATETDGLTIDYNLYNIELSNMFWTDHNTLASMQALGKEAHSLVGNPDFVSSTDLHLQTGSPAIGKGIHIEIPETDYDGKYYNDPPSIGAYEGNPPKEPKPPDPGEKQIIILYPNPADGNLTILREESNLATQRFRIISISGKIVFEDFLKEGIKNAQFSLNLKAGIYVVQVLSGNLTTAAQTLIVVKL